MYAKQLSEQIAVGFARCTRQFSNYYDWEFELEFQVRVAMNPENPGFLIGTLLLLEGVKNPVRKTLISVCYQSERDLAKTFVDLYFDTIPENIRNCRAFKDRFLLQKFGWIDPLQN